MTTRLLLKRMCLSLAKPPSRPCAADAGKSFPHVKQTFADAHRVRSFFHIQACKTAPFDDVPLPECASILTLWNPIIFVKSRPPFFESCAFQGEAS